MKTFKEQIFDSESGEYTYIDNRIFSMCVERQMERVREGAKQRILAVAPEHKQRNAALGLLDSVQTQALKDAIQDIRNQSNIKEQQILSITWDGQESTRSTACDAVQAVNWE